MDLQELEGRMLKSIDVFSQNLSEVRAGRANPAILNRISVEYYGVLTPINQVAGISVPEARTIVIQPWDASVLKAIEKAILASDIGLNPNNDGKVIRLNFPDLTEERRKELAKEVRKIAEEAKVGIRSIRRDGMDTVKDEQKRSEITEDQKADFEDKIQKFDIKSFEQNSTQINNLLQNLNLPQDKLSFNLIQFFQQHQIKLNIPLIKKSRAKSKNAITKNKNLMKFEKIQENLAELDLSMELKGFSLSEEELINLLQNFTQGKIFNLSNNLQKENENQQNKKDT